MMRFALKRWILAILLAAAEVAGTHAQEALKQSWGPEVRGAKMRLSGPTLLRYGQPFELPPVELSFPRPPLPKGATHFPGVAIVKEEGQPVITVEVMDAKGQRIPFRIHHQWDDIPFRVQSFHEFFESNEVIDHATPFRLFPAVAQRRGRYWKPGAYFVRAMYECPRDPMRPYAWHGKLESNKLRVEIVEADTPILSPLADPKVRKRLEACVADLDSPEFATREAAQKSLLDFGVFALPLIDAAISKASPEAAKRLKLIVEQQTSRHGDRYFWASHNLGFLLAGLDDETWKTLQKHIANDPTHDPFTRRHDLAFFPFERARFSPVLPLPEAELAKLLSHAELPVRVRAIRSLQPTNNKDTLGKLIACLDALLREQLENSPSSLFPVVNEAGDAVISQGQTVVPLLLDLARKPRNEKWGPTYLAEVARLLGKIGPSPEAEAFMDGMLKDEDIDVRGAGLRAFKNWGRAAVPRLLRVAQDSKEHPTLRRIALEHVGHFGTADEVGDYLRSMLQPGVHPSMAWTAIDAMRKRRKREALPDLKRIATQTLPLGSHTKAIEAVVALGGKEEVSQLLREILERDRTEAGRFYAAYYLGYTRDRAGVLKLLELLGNPDIGLRNVADVALRAIADLPEGVGYDLKNPNADLWRKWWQKHK